MRIHTYQSYHTVTVLVGTLSTSVTLSPPSNASKDELPNHPHDLVLVSQSHCGIQEVVVRYKVDKIDESALISSPHTLHTSEEKARLKLREVQCLGGSHNYREGNGQTLLHPPRNTSRDPMERVLR